MRTTNWLRVWLCLVFSVGSASAQPTGTVGDPSPRILPVDEADEDATFFAFRAQLQRVIAERDTAGLLAVLDPAVQSGFGGDFGVDAFEQKWFRSPGEDVWSELGQVLSLGGRFTADSLFVAPYVSAGPFRPGDRPDDYDPYEALFTLGEAVPVYASPLVGADTLAVISFHLVRHEWRTSVADPPSGWTAIRLTDDSIGFVESRWLRSPIDYRATFQWKGGQWRMIGFLSGD